VKPDRRSGHQSGATAVGASALGTGAIGTAALGALALGAVALGALAIGRLAVRRARIRSLVIDELVIRRLRVLDPEWPALPDDGPAVIDLSGEGRQSGDREPRETLPSSGAVDLGLKPG
jgi:hypothetical protein